MNNIELNPRLISKIYVFMICFILSLFIDNKIPEDQINLTGKIQILKSRPVIITTDNIKTIKSYLDLALLVFCIYSAIEVKSKGYRINCITLDHDDGIFNTRKNSIEMTHIYDFQLTENIFQRLIGVATLRVISKDKTTPELFIRGISHHDAEEGFEFLRLNSINSMVGEMVRRRSLPKKSRN